MSEDILVPRHWAFAFLFPGQPPIKKPEILAFYEAITKAKIDVPEIRIAEQEAVFLNQRSGNGGQSFQIQVGHYQSNFRLLVLESHPTASLDYFAMQVDPTWDAFRSIWSFAKLILTEATLRYTAVAPEKNAIQYLAKQLGLTDERMGSLGRPVELLGLRLGTPVGYAPNQTLPLQGASAAIRVENLLEDPTKIYFELTSTWPALPLPELPGQRNLPREINAVPQKPSTYLKEAAQFLMKQVCAFAGLKSE